MACRFGLTSLRAVEVQRPRMNSIKPMTKHDVTSDDVNVDKTKARDVVDVDSLDYVHFVVPDIHGLPRGVVVPKRYVADTLTCRRRLNLAYVSIVNGPQHECLVSESPELEGLDNRTWVPIPSTLTATPWSDSGQRRTGSVLCQLTTREDTVDDLDLRHIVQRLVQKLKHDHGLTIKVAFEYEFRVFKKDHQGSLECIGGSKYVLCNMRGAQPSLDLFMELTEELSKGGFHAIFIQAEYYPGQWELNFEPQEGLWGADFAFHVRNAIKIFFARRGYIASFMTCPLRTDFDSGLDMNHSLWTEGGRNAMADRAADGCLSRLALRWNAGLLHHAPAMTALCCPTPNCYRKKDAVWSSPYATWSVEYRTALMRFKVSNDDVYMESRLSSSAANPYLVLACHLAAGLDGLQQEMTSPPPGQSERSLKLPSSLEEAFCALENDDAIKNALGSGFVSLYVSQKRAYDVKPYEERGFKTVEEEYEYEREQYLEAL